MTDHALPLLHSHDGTAAPPPAPRQARDGLRDAHGRVVRDLRLSVTDRCNFRCTYCMEEDERFAPKQSLLSLDQYVHIIDAAIGLGVTKLRLTGGEPTLYPQLDELIAAVGQRALDDVAMTTNGWRLTMDQAKRWIDSGLHRLTFSLDTLRNDRMAAITRRSTTVETVLASIETARNAGFPQPKVNIVLMRGVNDDEAVDFAELARRADLNIRFIEFMPLDASRQWQRDQVVSAQDTIKSITQVYPLEIASPAHAAQTSSDMVFADGAPGRLGFISPVSQPFCGACNRLRVTAEGMIRPCLFSNQEWSLRTALASGDVSLVQRTLQDALWTKEAGHKIGRDDFDQPARGMRAIGG